MCHFDLIVQIDLLDGHYNEPNNAMVWYVGKSGLLKTKMIVQHRVTFAFYNVKM